MQRQPGSIESFFQAMSSGQFPGQAEASGQQQPQVMRVPARNSSGRKMGGVNTGDVALAMSGMSFYWTMPMMMQMARNQRRRRKPAKPAADTPASETPYT